MHARWYHHVLMLKKWHRYALTFSIGALLFLVWAFFLYMPLHKHIMQVTVDVHQRKQDLKTSVSEQRLCKRLSQECSYLQQECQKHSTCDRSQQAIDIIMSLCAASNLYLCSLQKGIQKIKTSHAYALMIVEAQGTLASISAFFENIDKKQLLIYCAEFHIERREKDIYSLQITMKFLQHTKNMKNESPSTLEKAEGLGG